MSEILFKYKLTFDKNKILDREFKICYSEIEIVQLTLCSLVSEIKDPNNVDVFIMNIDKVLNNTYSDISVNDSPSDTVMAYIEPTNTKFCEISETGIDYNNPDYTIPTTDFRDVLVEWKKYLELPD